MMGTGSERPRVLIVEDESLLMMDLEDTLCDLGYAVVGKGRDIAAGVALARELALDVAILDMNLAGFSGVAIADILQERGIPFVMVSGYASVGIPDRHRNAPRIAKPCERATLSRTLASMLAVKSTADR